MTHRFSVIPAAYVYLLRPPTHLGGAEEVLSLSGVRVAPYKVAIFTLAGAFYGLAGVMVTSQLSAGLVQAGKGYDFAAITAAVVGGTLLTGGRGGVLHSAEALEQALTAFEGTVLAVTHDRWFARSFERFLVFGSDGRVVETPEPVWDEARVSRAR